MQNTKKQKIERLTYTTQGEELMNDLFRKYVRAIYPEIYIEIEGMVIKDVKIILKEND